MQGLPRKGKTVQAQQVQPAVDAATAQPQPKPSGPQLSTSLQVDPKSLAQLQLIMKKDQPDSETEDQLKKKLKQADGWFWASDNYSLLAAQPGGKPLTHIQGAVLAYTTSTGLSRKLTSVPNMVSKLMGNYPVEIKDKLVIIGKNPEIVTALG